MWMIAAYVLTAARIPFAIAFWLTYGAPLWSLGWVIAAGISDALDGRCARYARRRAGIPETTPSVGAWLDPAADKLFAVIALLAIAVHEPGAWPLIGCLAAREIILIPAIGLYTALHHLGRVPTIELRAHLLGKIATVVQLVAVGVIVAPGPVALAARWPLAIAGGAIGLAAAIEQLLSARAKVTPPG